MATCYDACGTNSTTEDEYNACLADCEQTYPDGVDPFVDLLECAFNDECVNSCAA